MSLPLILVLQFVGVALMFFGGIVSYSSDTTSPALVIGIVLIVIGGIGYRKRNKNKEHLIVKG